MPDPSTDQSPSPILHLTFPCDWKAEILPIRPLILPQRRFVYPREVEEVERGALEVLVRPASERPEQPARKDPPPARDSFLATCALGFRDPAVPTGLWSCPRPEEICAVAGGYAYIIDTAAPERFTMLPYRPVLHVRPAPAPGLLLFVGNRSILAWGARGQAWESRKLSDEGLTITAIDDRTLHGRGWSMITDQETPFALDLDTGQIIPQSLSS